MRQFGDAPAYFFPGFLALACAGRTAFNTGAGLRSIAADAGMAAPAFGANAEADR